MHWLSEVTKEQLNDVIQAVRKIDDNHKNMEDEMIVEQLLNDKVSLYSFWCDVLKHLDKQFPEICITAVREDCNALQYVKEQTPEMCIAAVQRIGWALRYVREQTPEMCIAAVQWDGSALEYVKEQTPEICLAAVKQNNDALGHIRDEKLRGIVGQMLVGHVSEIKRAFIYNGNVFCSLQEARAAKKEHESKNKDEELLIEHIVIG